MLEEKHLVMVFEANKLTRIFLRKVVCCWCVYNIVGLHFTFISNCIIMYSGFRFYGMMVYPQKTWLDFEYCAGVMNFIAVQSWGRILMVAQFFITSTTPPLHWINLILSRTICKGTSCIRFYIHCNHFFILTKRRRMCLAFLLVLPLSPTRWLHSPLCIKQCPQKSNVYRMLARCTECSLNIPIYTQCSQ